LSFSGDTPEQQDAPGKPEAKQDIDTPPYSEREMVNMVRQEMERSIGFENDQTLLDERLRALNYYQGDMKKDIPSLPNRSAAVSTDVADAVETILPDIMEIFTSGGDVATFIPNRPGDEDAARQETEYLNHVIFQDNPGFLNLQGRAVAEDLPVRIRLEERLLRRRFHRQDPAGADRGQPVGPGHQRQAGRDRPGLSQCDADL